MKTLLVGSGNIARFYISYLESKQIQFSILSPRYKPEVVESLGFLDKFYTDLEDISLNSYSRVILACPIEHLFSYSRYFLVKSNAVVLCEKPGVLNEDLSELSHLAPARLFYAFNRRFYRTVQGVKAQLAIVENQESLMSVTLDERVSTVANSRKSGEVKAKWLFANTSHPIDTALYLFGYQRLEKSNIKMISSGAGVLEWHPSASQFFCSIDNAGSVLTMSSNWNGDGGWTIKLQTRQSDIYMPNMETLQLAGTTEFEEDCIKPGFSEMLDSFYGNRFDRFCSLNELIILRDFIYKLGRYT